MRRFTGVLILLTTPLPLVADDDTKKELKALEGSWKAVALETGGKPLPKEAVPEFTYTISADGKAAGKSPRGEYSATVIIDPKKDPKAIDNVHESGPQKGKKQYGVYKLEGDKLTVCMTAPGAAETDRPESFSTKDNACVLFVFERAKKDK
jgi:uncharacterized protein (TIGR03067 family)